MVDKKNDQQLFDGVYKNRRVFITGHTGFKGSWLSLMLNYLGAEVYGYALDPPTNPSLFVLAKVDQQISSTIGDIRDYKKLFDTLNRVKPEIVIHMAAQPLVRESYKNPIETYSTNVMGTVNLLEAIRHVKGVKAVINITTDKCYENREWIWGYRENEPMGGYDPYSNSKGCSELVTSSFRNSFFNPKDYKRHGVALASARAGNVIGGGDWAEDRLIPDFIRSIMSGEKIKIRSPQAIRPWQHVLEPLTGYLRLAEKLYLDGSEFAQAWNFGPYEEDAKSVEWIVKFLCNNWGNGVTYEIDSSPQPHEANYLKLDCSKAHHFLDWYPRWNLDKTLESIIEFTKVVKNNGDIKGICNKQIEEYFNM